jgi:hypothetical protein
MNQGRAMSTNARHPFILLSIVAVEAFFITPFLGKDSTTTSPATASTTTASSGPTYYISPNGNDSNNGSQSTPWRTIQKAANTVNPGDTVVLMDGTYTQGSVGFNRSGTSDKPIVFMAQNKWQAVVASTSGCQPGFSINASYITVKDLTFSVAGNTCTTYTSSNVHIRAWNTVDPTPSNPTSGSAGFHADGLKLTSGLARSEALKSNQDYSIIENTESDNALEIFNNKNSIVRNNLISGQDRYGVSILAKGGVRSAQIYNNVVRNHSSHGYGIYLGGYSCDTCFFDPTTKIEAYNSVAYNNVVVNDSGHLNALVFAGAKDSAFFNNVVVGGGVVTMQGGYNTGFRAPTSNPTLMNNIIACNGAQAISGTYSGTFHIESNDFQNCSGTPSQTNAVAGDPMFMNSTPDWNLQSASPARKRGSKASIIGYDGQPIDVSPDRNGVVPAARRKLGIYDY